MDENTIRYPYLPQGRTILYVPPEDQYMQAAAACAKTDSTDRLVPTGSVVVREGVIIGRGANQVPIKNPYFAEFHRKHLCVRRLLKVPSGQKYWLCPGCASPSEHSEQRAIRNARAAKQDTHGADLYLWGHWWCCEPCWNAIIGAGIANVYLMRGSEVIFNSRPKA